MAEQIRPLEKESRRGGGRERDETGGGVKQATRRMKVSNQERGMKEKEGKGGAVKERNADGWKWQAKNVPRHLAVSAFRRWKSNV